MSSHHIVREKQEPALLVLGMDGFSDELLGQLLEWSPTVIVTEIMAEKLNADGIKIDWIIADHDSEAIQSDVELLPLIDSSLIKTALNFLTANNFPAVNVVTDELNINDYLPYADKITLVIFYGHQKIYPVTPGFSKWKPAAETIKLLTHPDNLKVTGLEKAGENLFKTTSDGIFSIRFDQSFLFIAEDL